MALRRMVLVLAASTVLILGSSLAQLEGTGSGPDPIDSGGNTDSFSGLDGGGDLTGDGQGMTGVDSGGDSSSGEDSSGDDLPWLSGGMPPNFVPGQPTGGIDSGMISDPIPRLILSEVYYDGTDERIEITNIGDGGFSGTITLEGAKNTPVSLTSIFLLSGESKIFGDILAQVSGTSFIGKTGLALNLTDTAPISVYLSISGQREDEFLVDSYRVNLYNDKKTSFEKIAGIPTRTSSGSVMNAQSGYTINPGVYFRTGDNINDVSFPPAQSGDSLQLPISCNSLDPRNLMKVDEIFPGDETYPPYIELAIYDDITIDTLSISGTALSGAVVFSGNTGGMALQKNTFLLISATGLRQSEGIQSVRNRDFSLLSTGNRLLITIGSGQSRRVMDIVYLSGNSTGKSWYFNTTTYQCARILDSLDDFSPGFERRFLKYIPGYTGTKIEYVYIYTGNQSSGGNCPNQRSGTQNTGENQINSSGFSVGNYTIRILNVDYDPEGSDTDNEKITLLATNSSGDQTPLDLSKIFRLKVNGTNKTLPRMLPINIPTTFVKTFGFPNSTKSGEDVVVQLTYGDHIFDTYMYNPNNLSGEEEIITGDVESTGMFLDLSGFKFSITYVLPNPKGKDDAEEIGIRADSENPELTGINLSEGFYIKITTKKKLSGTIMINKENILSGNLGLVNKAACVSLIYKEQELTKFCYRTPKEGQKIYASDLGLEETTAENLDILNALQLKKIDSKLCIRYKEQQFLCKNIPASKAAWKTAQEQKLYKGFASLVKSYIINNRKTLYYDTPLKEYYDRLAQDKKLIGLGMSYVDIYGQSVLITDLKQQMKILQTTLPGIIALFAGEESLH